MKRLPWTMSLGLAVGVMFMSAQLRLERAECRGDRAQAEATAARTEAANEARKSVAADAFVQRTVALQPIILGSNQKADFHAQTPAGRAPCLAGDRLQSIRADRTALFAFTPASRAGRVPAGAIASDDAVER
jgi:hypothetical protein